VVYIAYSDVQRRIKRRKIRFRLIMFIITISAIVVFLFSTPVLKVKKINVSGNNVISAETIVELSGIKTGDNLLKLNIGEINNSIMVNPYIKKSSVRRSLSGNVYIKVEERQNAAILAYGQKFSAVDSYGVVTQIYESREGLNLPIIEGVSVKNAIPGKIIELDDTGKLNSFKIVLKSITNCNFFDIINGVDISNILSIVVKTRYEINIKLGSVESIDRKLEISKAIMDNDVRKKGLKGTIDISFNGNPVFRQE
jgi:cell division protein FtsQ